MFSMRKSVVGEAAKPKIPIRRNESGFVTPETIFKMLSVHVRQGNS